MRDFVILFIHLIVSEVGLDGFTGTDYQIIGCLEPGFGFELCKVSSILFDTVSLKDDGFFALAR